MTVKSNLPVLLAAPIIFMGMVAVGVSNGNTALFTVIGMAAWMIIWWISDVVPMAATALLPLLILPVSGLLTIKAATANYANPIIYLFLAGFMIAIGLEKSGLHKRIALNILKVTGTSANSIVWGFLLATAFISMWVSNTATTLMMLPIALSVSGIIEEQIKGTGKERGITNFNTTIMLGVASAANIGGCATLIGTPTNVVTAGFVRDLAGNSLSFGSYMLMGLPMMFLMLGIAYFVMVKWMFPNNIGKIENLKEIIGAQIQALGKWSDREIAVTIVFAIVVTFWVLGQPLNMLIGRNIFDDTVVGLFGAVLMFVIPLDYKTKKFIMDWEDVKHLPWNIILLFGGGLCLATAMQEVGLMEMIGNSVAKYISFSPALMLLTLTFLIVMLSELMSNVALATIFVPVAIGLAQTTGQDPVMFGLCVGIAASYAFMMPIGTPPNAIVYGTGKVSVRQMVRAGAILNVAAVLLIFALVNLFYRS